MSCYQVSTTHVLAIVKWAEKNGHLFHGPTPLIAAMRCYVASQMGETTDVPEVLL